MPPKKTISKNSRHSKEQLGFRELVSGTIINDEQWRCLVTMLVETDENYAKFTSILNETCKNGYRKAIRAISRENVVKEITAPPELHPFTSDRTNQDDQLREWLCSELLQTDHANNSGDGVYPKKQLQSTKLEAILVLWAVREARLESLSRREAELALARERELEVLAMKDEVAPRAGSARKHNSRLRKRGEDWRDIVYVDDAPVQGPDLYILLTGFYDPALPVELIKIGLPLRCILRLEINLDDKYESILGVTNLSSLDGSLSSPSATLPNSFEPRPSLASIPAAGDSSKQSKFWSIFDGSGCCSVAIRCFSPTWDLVTTSPSKMYDGISYIMYDVQATIEEHEAYLRAMKVYQVSEPRESSDSTMSSYEDWLGQLPDGLSDSVPVILDALLRQVEENLLPKLIDKFVPVSPSSSREASESSEKRQQQTEGESDACSSRGLISSAQARLEAKLAQLNSKYEMFGLLQQQQRVERPERIEGSMQRELGLLLHGDSLRMDLYRALVGGRGLKDGLEEEIERLSERIPEEPHLERAWRAVDQRELEVCRLHIPGVYECCRREGVDRLKAKHLLNLLGLRKLFRSSLGPKEHKREDKSKVREREFDELHMKSHTMNEDKRKTCRMHEETNQLQRSASASQSENFLINNHHHQRQHHHPPPPAPHPSTASFSPSSTSGVTASSTSSSTRSRHHHCGTEHRHHHVHHQASSCIRESVDVGNMLRSFENCAALFELVDARESLGIEHQLQKQQSHLVHQKRISMEGFEHAELISSRAFPQIIRECVGRYEYAVVRHFEPTDSVLLLFQHEVSRAGDLNEIRRVYSLRTPVCLRDFCDYVVAEESEWLEKRRKLRETGSGGLAERCRRKMLAGAIGENGGSAGRPEFRDEDFVLPGSIKECLIRMQQQETSNNDALPESQARTTSLTINANKQSSSQIGSFKRNSLEKKSKSPASANASHSSTNTSCGSSQSIYEFFGYDVGGGQRVQLTHHRWTYRACDGTVLRLERDSWLFERENWTHVTAGTGAWELHYFEHFPDRMRHHFRLAHPEGASVNFTKKKRDLGPLKPYGMLYQIMINWPTGLTVYPVEYEDAEYPFYIHQKYSSPEPVSNESESYRKYLPNGDVVKFHFDESIVVLRPNGTVITDIEFDESQEDCHLRESHYGDLESRQISWKKSSLDQTWSLGSFASAEDNAMVPPNYTVLEPDGRQYRVYGSEQYIVELERIRIRAMEEYSTREKFVRRADGTDMLFNDDAELIIDFPDGTRTLMGCRVEEENFELDWSEDELDVYFGSSSNNRNSSFVSLSIYTRAEHPNYATVERDGDECGLSIGSSLPRFHLTPKGTGEILLPGDRARLQLTETEVSLSRLPNCNSPHCILPTSRATFHPLNPTSLPMLTFHDSIRRIIFARSPTGLEVQEIPSNGDTSNELCCCCEKETFGTKMGMEKYEGLRMFAVGRDGEAHEYLQNSMVKEIEERMMDEEKASLIVRQINDRPEVEYRLHLRSLSGLRVDWPLQYRIPKAAPRPRYICENDDDDDDDDADCDEAWNGPLLASCNETAAAKAIGRCDHHHHHQLLQSRVLIARLLEGVGRESENCLVSMQKALVRYWRELAMGVRKEARGNVTAMCDCRGDTETQLRDIVLERDKTIDLEIYEAGRQHLKNMKVARDEERTRLVIDGTYDRRARQNKCSRPNDE